MKDRDGPMDNYDLCRMISIFFHILGTDPKFPALVGNLNKIHIFLIEYLNISNLGNIGKKGSF